MPQQRLRSPIKVPKGKRHVLLTLVSTERVGVRALAERAGVSRAQASAFLREYNDAHRARERLCRVLRRAERACLPRPLYVRGEDGREIVPNSGGHPDPTLAAHTGPDNAPDPEFIAARYTTAAPGD